MGRLSGEVGLIDDDVDHNDDVDYNDDYDDEVEDDADDGVEDDADNHDDDDDNDERLAWYNLFNPLTGDQ